MEFNLADLFENAVDHFADRCCLVVDGKRAGPYDAHELGEQVNNGSLTRDTLVWRGGMRKWRAASELDELHGLFDSGPPPVPS